MSAAQSVEILLVEDNRDDAELALRSLSRSHLTNPIHVVKDGQEALDFMFCAGEYAHRSIDDLPKVILLDIKLPKVDGLEVLRQLKSDDRTRLVPVVLLTSSQEEKDMIAGYGHGANSYIVKPVDFQQFSSVMTSLGMYWLMLNEIPPAHA